MIPSHSKKLLVVCSLVLCWLSFGSAQTTNASIVGIVTDPSGGAIPAAVVVATNSATLVSRTVTTNEAGAYTISPLIPGSYDVKVSNPGFKTQVHSNLTLETGAVLKADFQLDVGAISESVEVMATAAALQTQEASVGGVVTTSQLERIPVNGRNFTRLIALMPGTSDIGPSQSKGGQAGMQMMSVNGQRQQDNNFTIDGVDNNMMYMSSGVGAPPMDAIQEFRVATNNSAEYGRSSGANVNIAIKSGTRDLHGSVYEYFRNDKLDANEWFANREGRGKVPFRQNQYGVAVGGPVVIPKIYHGREKTFWFASWEGFRRRRGNTSINTTPIAAWRDGDFTANSATIYDPLTGALNAAGRIVRQPFGGNVIPKERLNAGMVFLTQTYMPTPNRPGSANNYIQTQSTANDRDMIVLRGDHTLGAKDNVFARYFRQRVAENSPSAYPIRYNGLRMDSDNVGVGWNHVFNPTTVLEVKYGYNHPDNPQCDQFTNAMTRADALSQAGVKLFDTAALCNVLPAFQAVGLFTIAGGGGETIIDTDHQYEAKISKMMGRHSFRMGFMYMRRAMDAFFANPTNGNADFYKDVTGSDTDPGSGNSYATLLLGYPSYVRRGLGIPNAQGRQNAYSTFFQDDWRVTDRLTVNLGVRWEGFNRPYDAQDKLGNLLITRDMTAGTDKAQLMWAGVNPLPDPLTGKVGEPPRTLGYGKSLMRNNWRNFAPRVGIAYQINSKTVLRTAYGIFFNSTFMQELNDLRKFWPYLPQQEISPNRGALPDLTVAEPGPSFNSTQAIGGWPQDPNNRTPYSQQWNVYIQRQLMNDVTLDIGYVGASNRRQIGYVGWNNALQPGPGRIEPRRRLASSGFTGNMDGGSNVFSSEYNAFEAKFTKRFSKSLSVLANYTWGKSMDDQSSLSEAKYQDFTNRRLDWSRSSWDLKHAFKLGYVYDVPVGRGRGIGAGMNPFLDAVVGGWALEGILQIQSGRPRNVTSGTDTANVGKYQGRPDVVGNPILPVSQRSVDRWFNIAAFVMPQKYTYGNSGSMVLEDDGKTAVDLSIAKKFRTAEKQALEFRTEFFNLPNVINFSGPNTNLSSPTFGKITGASSSRQIQFALRYAF